MTTESHKMTTRKSLLFWVLGIGISTLLAPLLFIWASRVVRYQYRPTMEIQIRDIKCLPDDKIGDDVKNPEKFFSLLDARATWKSYYFVFNQLSLPKPEDYNGYWKVDAILGPT